MGIFDGMEMDDTIQGESDVIGGFNILDSDTYGLTVVYAYVSESKGGATGLNLLLETPDKQSIRQTFWMTSGKAKGGKNFYIDKKTKKKNYLPGFNNANALALLTVGKPIIKLDSTVKTIKLYDYELKKEAPVDVDMLVDLIGVRIIGGVLKQTVDKKTLNKATGVYTPTGETRDENDIDKLFRAADKLTVLEVRGKITEPLVFDKWVKAWKGKVKNKATKTGVTNGAPSAGVQSGAQAPAEDLFE